MYQLRGTVLCAIIAATTLCRINTMDQSLYPLVNVTDIRQRNTHEKEYLLAERSDPGVHYPVLTRVVQAPPPAYHHIYMTEEDSEKELSEMRALLAQQEEELTKFPKNKGWILQALEEKRKEENICSNATVASTAFGYYMIMFWLQIGGDPRVWENQGNNWSILPFANNFAGWLGSQIYGMTQCCCRNDKEQ